LKNRFSRCAISHRLKVDAHYFAILFNSPPEVVLLAVGLHKDFVDEVGVTESIAYSRARLPLISREACHPFHSKAATDSTAKLPPRQAAWDRPTAPDAG